MNQNARWNSEKCTYIPLFVSEWIHSNWQKKRRLNKEEMETNVTSQKTSDTHLQWWWILLMYLVRKDYAVQNLPRNTRSYWGLEYTLPFPSGVRRLGLEASHSPPANTECKNECRYTSSPTTCLHGLHSHNFTFLRSQFYIALISKLYI
jgi:hypothetical protein